jgi:predicted alpha/beta superfamily hydrolase
MCGRSGLHGASKIEARLTIVNFRPPIVRMRTLMLSLLILITSAASAATVTFRVTVPKSTPADAKLFLAGDANELGTWKEDGVALEKGVDGVYAAKVALPDGAVSYKVTRGSWGTVEKNADGSERDNRTLKVQDGATVDITVAAWADQVQPEPPKSTATGDIRIHEKFASKNLGNARRLIVWLPPGYEQDTQKRYDVLYMHDGQNLFDAATSFAGEWKADETARLLIQQNKITPIIIVGIDNNGRRIDEYTMTRDDRRGAGGKGAAYVKFVAEEVKPFIDKAYRTNGSAEHTGVAGSSLGGTISLELVRAYPTAFGKCAAMSPAAWWNDGEMLKRLELDGDAPWAKGKRIWVDVGTKEGEADQHEKYLDGVKRIAAVLKHAGLKEGGDYEARIIVDAAHNEAAWAERFGEVLTFLFPAAR